VLKLFLNNNLQCPHVFTYGTMVVAFAPLSG
jgi:hypothetical protein